MDTSDPKPIRNDPNAPVGLGRDDEGVGNIRPDSDSDANSPAALGPDEEGLGNIRPDRGPASEWVEPHDEDSRP